MLPCFCIFFSSSSCRPLEKDYTCYPVLSSDVVIFEIYFVLPRHGVELEGGSGLHGAEPTCRKTGGENAKPCGVMKKKTGTKTCVTCTETDSYVSTRLKLKNQKWREKPHTHMPGISVPVKLLIYKNTLISSLDFFYLLFYALLPHSVVVGYSLTMSSLKAAAELKVRIERPWKTSNLCRAAVAVVWWFGFLSFWIHWWYLPSEGGKNTRMEISQEGHQLSFQSSPVVENLFLKQALREPLKA